VERSVTHQVTHIMNFALDHHRYDWYNEVRRNSSRAGTSGIRAYRCLVVRFREEIEEHAIKATPNQGVRETAYAVHCAPAFSLA
jgi:type IV secretory pathway TrbF-like protein